MLEIFVHAISIFLKPSPVHHDSVTTMRHEIMETAAAVQTWIGTHLPGLDGTRVAHHYRCRYTNVAHDDGGFVVGPHPECSDIVLACAFNGEGFKFATAIGEMAADLAVGVPPRIPEAVNLFDPSRLALATTKT